MMEVFWTVLATALVASMIVITGGRKAKIVETLGRPRKKAFMPGPGIKLPWPIERVVGVVNLQQQVYPTDVGVKTKDDAFVNFPVSIQYYADSDPEGAVKAHYEYQNPKKVIKTNVLNSVRTAASALTLEELYANKASIEEAVKSELDEALSRGGYTILKVLVDEPMPDARIVDAKNQKLAAIALEEAATHEGKAEKIRIVMRAEADAESKKLQGTGMADMRTEMAKGAKAAIESLTFGNIGELQAFEVFNEVNRQDSLVTAARNGNLILMDLSKDGSAAELGKFIAAAKAAGADGDKDKEPSEDK